MVRVFVENRRVRRAERRRGAPFALSPEWWIDTLRQQHDLREDDDAWEESYHREQ